MPKSYFGYQSHMTDHKTLTNPCPWTSWTNIRKALKNQNSSVKFEPTTEP